MEITERKYISIKDIQNEYLPIGKKNIRSFVKDNLPYKIIGGRIFVERNSFEQFLSTSDKPTIN